MVEQVTFQVLFQFLQTVGILVGVFYYIMTIRTNQRNQEISLRNQELTLQSQELTRKAQEQAVETRQAQLFMNIYNQSFTNREWLNAYNKVMTTHWDSYEEYLKIADFRNPDSSDKEYLEAQSYVSSFYEGLGVFVKEGLVGIRLVALTMTFMTRSLWEKLAPVVYESRKRWDYPRMLSEFEYLYDELMKYVEEHPELMT
jgi:hypothetical protein